MPKIIKQEEDFEEEIDEEEDDDNWDSRDEEPKKETRGRKKKVIEQEEPKRRFGLIGPQPLRIVDTETKELIGEGEFAVIQALTDILERLERIEVQIGALTG